jgi:hypothetical protein
VKKALITMTENSRDIESLTDPEKLARLSTGIVAWTITGPVDRGEWVHISTVAYFEDINAVSLGRTAGPDVPWIDFQYETTADGQSLVVMDKFREMLVATDDVGLIGESERERAAAMWQLMKPLLTDMKTSFSITVPGPVVAAPAFLQTADRQASFVAEGAQLFAWSDDPTGFVVKLRDVAKQSRLRIVWKETTVTAAERAAFQQEVADARLLWRRALDDRRARRDHDRPPPP